MFEFRFYEIWRNPDYIEHLFNGIFVSFWLTSIAALLGFLLALALACGRLHKSALIRWPTAIYVEVIRNTPLIVQLFFVVFGLPMALGYRWPFELSALFALALNFSAYYSEIVRAGLENLHSGQNEAALSLSLSKPKIFFLVTLPQALGNIYPSLVSQFIFLFLTTGIISEIGIEELTWSGRFIADRTFRDFEVYLVLTACYVLMALLFRGFFTLLGQRTFPWLLSRANSS